MTYKTDRIFELVLSSQSTQSTFQKVFSHKNCFSNSQGSWQKVNMYSLFEIICWRRENNLYYTATLCYKTTLLSSAMHADSISFSQCLLLQCSADCCWQPLSIWSRLFEDTRSNFNTHSDIDNYSLMSGYAPFPNQIKYFILDEQFNFILKINCSGCHIRLF